MRNGPNTESMNGPDAGRRESYSTDRRDYAPYAREVIEQQRAGRNPAVFVFAGSDGANQADYRRRLCGMGSALVLPPGKCPHGYFWPALDAPIVIQGDCTADRFNSLLRCLTAAGGRSIGAVPAGAPPFVAGDGPNCPAAFARLAVIGLGGAS